MPTETMRGNFVVLRAGPLHLILPQGEVGAAEHIEGGLRSSGRPGVFSRGEGSLACDVVAPSERLEALEAFPADRFVLTRLGTGVTQFAWNEMKVLLDVSLVVRTLPEALQVAGGPIEGFVDLQGTIAFRTDAQRIVSYMALGEG
jgi:hypothetical protein